MATNSRAVVLVLVSLLAWAVVLVAAGAVLMPAASCVANASSSQPVQELAQRVVAACGCAASMMAPEQGLQWVPL